MPIKMALRPPAFWPYLLLLSLSSQILGEHVRELEISEGVPVGTKIGYVGDSSSPESGPPYLIVPVGSSVDSDLQIDQNTGEIRTKVPLDRETRASYSLVAIPMSGDNVKVIVKVLDENDNAPTFSQPVVHIEFPENTPRDVKRTLPPAKDLDLDVYNTQRYNIVSGNTNNAFRLSSHRERDGVLYLDLQINGFLDRETCDSYNLVIEALDGGTPPLRGEMTVNITIQDVNDQPPVFNQTRYFASVPENSTVGTKILHVFATDADIEENAEVEYSINRRQSDKDMMFRINSTTGAISVNKPLDFEAKELHELVVVAKDRGLQPLEATAFVSIKVIDVNDNLPTINVIFLSDDATPKISEASQVGEFVARISVHDPDSKTEYSNVNVTLSGGDGHFGLTTRDNIIYLVVVSLPLDRETKPNYTLNIEAMDTGNPPLHASRIIDLHVMDVNDNKPEFDRDVYEANVMEVSDPGTSVIQLTATDRDDGNNSLITYSLQEPANQNTKWFQIDSRTGLVTTRAHVDCETEPVPKLTVIATDNGFPPLSSSATVLVTIHDVNDNEPIFDQSFYNVSAAEDEAVGRCILKVAATDPDCGVNAVVNYTLGVGFEKLEFKVRSDTGEICISSTLDYETRNLYEFPVIATDRGGLSTTAMVKIQISDVNDNRPTFYPSQYNVSLRDGGASSSATTPVVVVSATDLDSGKFGIVSYRIVSGNEAGLFRIDRNSGEIFVTRPYHLSTRTQPYHRLNISATDGGNLKSTKDAEVFISVIDSTQKPPIFEQPRYTFSVMENVRIDHIVGHVKATVVDNAHSNVKYSIYSGDPDAYFRIDSVTGAIRVALALDHETRASVLLNVQATSGHPPVYGHTQVNIDINDINDNAPEFESQTVKISVPENTEVGVPFYAAHANDRDSGSNGVIRYKMVFPNDGLFKIDPKSGHLTLARHLDYETSHRHTLVVTATDMGIPPLSTNVTVLVEVQDINDNPPVFETNEYNFSVSEALPVNSQIAQFTTVDADTGNNARITYRLLPSNFSTPKFEEVFGIFPNSGWLYLKENLDRETVAHYSLVISAKDNGTPSLTATSYANIEVVDSNDNDPIFQKESYEFQLEENLARGTFVGKVWATDRDTGPNAALRYSLIPGNGSFQINAITGEITTKEILDRESKSYHNLLAEARDQGSPPRSSRVSVKIVILDVNDNAPEIVDPQEDVVSVREEQSPGTDVVRVRAIDYDNGYNSSVTYSLIKSRDSDDADSFSIHPISGIIKTKVVLDHEEKIIYRLAVAATDGGNPPKQTVRMLRIEVLDLNDHRPTFTSSSLIFTIPENAKIGDIVGSVSSLDLTEDDNYIVDSSQNLITYTITSDGGDMVFDIDRSTGKIVVARELDREIQEVYNLDIRALDTSATNNPQSSAISVKIMIQDVNDNIPRWTKDPETIVVNEEKLVGFTIYNFTARDDDTGPNSDLKYSLVFQFPTPNIFAIDSLTGSLILTSQLDYETTTEYLIVVKATDQALNVSERLSSSITARIIVTDSNDNAPKFIVPQSHTFLLDKDISVGMLATHVLAVDLDSGDNGRVTYILLHTADAQYFSLGYDTGFLTLAKPLPKDTASFLLNITATDHGKPTKQTSMELKLVIQDSSENAPKFLDSMYEASVSENVPIGSLVTQLIVKGGIMQKNENLTFFIPPGIDDDTFEIYSPSGKVLTKKLLDREIRETYILPIYVTDDANDVTNFDLTKLKIKLNDINDYIPKFTRGSCYRLSVPENADTAIIHTVVAKDLDKGNNGMVSYSILSGNVGNKFSINSKTGEVTAKSLDRESHSRYHLTVMAKDHGSPSLQGYCNLTVFVEDQNDSDPKFDLSKYTTSIFEDTQVDTSVLKVHATDADIGLNAKIIYYLANESHWLFRIDNHTGVISSAGLFDRERQNEYNFMVVATDSGKYNTRSTKVPVTVYIKDINDNKPIFAKYPFQEKVPAYIQPGQAILKVVATDADEGINGDIVYSINNDGGFGKFRINPNTGIITATQSLASQNGKVLYLNVQATDKGNPSKSSNGLVEIIVGDLPPSSPKLRFHNSTYEVTIPENLEQFKDVMQVGAVRTDGRRQKVLYTFGTGNEDNVFLIDSDTGIIQVRDPKNLDFEIQQEINLVIEAKTEGLPNLHGYCDIKIKLTDQNDNAPKFTQQQYTASVSEEGKKGVFVLQVVASDADQDQNSRILYHIVDGNHDNAFKIEPAFSGVLRTNIALDREIRDNYRLTVIATDEGIPQMTGTARIRINVIDVNDNRPTFPPYSIIKVKEDVEIGTVLTTLTANDVDTFPELTYRFSPENDREYLKHFSIDRFSGKIVLKENLDFESWQEYKMVILASDGTFDAQTTLTIKVVDCNDNAPVFSQIVYEADLPDAHTTILSDILTLNASDLDSNDNAKIRYSLTSAIPGIFIGSEDGIIKVNTSNVSSTGQDIHLTVKAEDMGTPKLHSLASVRIRVKDKFGSSTLNKKEYKLNIPENTSIGKTLIHVAKPGGQNAASNFKILEGNDLGLFEISPLAGTLTLVHPMDRETKDRFDLVISVDSSRSVLIHVIINIEDVNDNAPVFSDTDFETSISEGLPVESYVGKVTATDADLSGTPNSEIKFDITSGNTKDGFKIDSNTGGIYVNQTLDFDKGVTEYNLIIRACDKGMPALCSLGSFRIILEDENDNMPMFPFSEYVEAVSENEPVGTAVFSAKATDLDKGRFGKINYSIVTSFKTSSKLFTVDSDTGLITTGAVFDYEQRAKYEFVIKATDGGGKGSTVKVQVNIEGKDEFYPQFTERTYRFTIATSYSMPTGYVIGFITASDKDKGPDGRVVYQLTTQHSFFKVNRTTGAILIKRKLQDDDFLTLGREVSLVVTASSGRQGSLTNMTVVEILLDPLADPGTNLAINGGQNTTINAPQSSISDWALGLLISIILLIITFGAVFVFMHMKNKRNRKTKKPNLSTETVSTSNNYVDPSNFDTIPVRGGHQMVGGQNQFAPPKYDEIPVYGSAGHPVPSTNSGAPTSEIAGSEQSGSSGRGSAEEGDDGEDEEIRMINEGPLQRDSGLHRQSDDDNLSNRSARNTQEYLARLGIVNTSTAHPQTMTNRHLPDPRATTSKESLHHHQPLDNLHNMFDDTEVENENDISNFYAKLSDVAGSDRASSSGEKPPSLGPSIEHVMAIGGYGELPNIPRHQPSMNGSLSSIVHSEEELAGSYNWDYLLDWGPQYQPLAHVFSEIARLKDDTVSVHSGASGTSSVGKKPAKSVPPPLITGVAPRSIAMPVLNSRGGPSARHGQSGHGQMMLPRSPINHDASGGSFSTSTAMSPSFSPSLSPLATKSPSISPLVAPGLSTAHHVMSRQAQNRQKNVVDTEMRL